MAPIVIPLWKWPVRPKSTHARSRARGLAIMVAGAAAAHSACAVGVGRAWIEQPLANGDDVGDVGDERSPNDVRVNDERPLARPIPTYRRPAVSNANAHASPHASQPESATPGAPSMAAPPPFAGDTTGNSLGLYRNTYYNAPYEPDFGGDKGPTAPLMSNECAPIALVSREFHDAVCMQGSGTLRDGMTVSFARRDCDCAQICPRSGYRICFDALDPARFPWGRGAAGRAIEPLVTVAADPAELPLGTPIYVREFDGAPRGEGGSALHDGCFVVEDRGVRVRGKHIDIFTGRVSATAFFNRIVPSNVGVHVIVGAARCEHLRR